MFILFKHSDLLFECLCSMKPFTRLFSYLQLGQEKVSSFDSEVVVISC